MKIEQGADRTRYAFTLIELSIVLVIIGLIVGGVLVGRDLIRAAEIRNMLSEKDKIVAAVHTYKLKYNCIPGDCKNGEQFWGSDASCPNTPANTTAKQETCNGNGDGKIDSPWGMPEGFRFWQQLGNAGLIAGQYSGTNATGDTNWRNNGNEVVVGVNVPNAAFNKQAGWMAINYVKTATANGWYVGNYGNFLAPGLPVWGTPGGQRDWQGTPFMTAQDADSTDAKIDDGKPNTGKVMANPNVKVDASATLIMCAIENDATAEYYTTAPGIICNLIFPNAF